MWFAGMGLVLSLRFGVTPAQAARPQVLTVVVADSEGQPVSNAWVRVPGAERERRVEPETGIWAAAWVTDTDGQPRIFTKGMELELTVTAPGYRPQRVRYRIRSRQNTIRVMLEPLPKTSPLSITVTEIGALMETWFQAAPPEEE